MLLATSTHSPPSRLEDARRSSTQFDRHPGTPTERQDLAALHLVERLLDLVEGDGLGHEAVEVEAALAGRGRSASGSRGEGRQSPYQLDFSAPPRPKTSMNGSSTHRRPGSRHADQDDGAGEVAGVERLLVAPSGCRPPRCTRRRRTPSVDATG